LGDAPTLVLGYGAIGAAVAAALSESVGVPQSSIYVCDPDPVARERAKEAGFVPWSRTSGEYTRFSLVVGCSGTSSFGVGDWVHLEDGAVLASASSGSAELSRELFIEMADLHDEDDVSIVHRETLATRPIHSEIAIKLVDRRVRFRNGGFPINFDGGVNCVPPEQIQLTRALMVEAAIQAQETKETGLLQLRAESCRWVTNKFIELTGKDYDAAAAPYARLT
jgi:hypothetical protein